MTVSHSVQKESAPGHARSTFPGFGEDAPLNLEGLSDDAVSGIASRIADGTFGDFASALSGTGNCSHPIRLRGRSFLVDAGTGEAKLAFDSGDLPFGVMFKACGNRRERVCPACSRVYARDMFELIRAGICGGRTVPKSVEENPLLFVTLTAPSFGFVHGGAEGSLCRPRRHDDRKYCPHGRPMWCTVRHDADNAERGTPLCVDCYDYKTHIVWQWWAPELWRRFTMNVRRGVARRLGVRDSELRAVASVQFAKVAEYQERGMVHFHALLRLDGPRASGVGSPAPEMGVNDFSDVVERAGARVNFTAPPVDSGDVTRRLLFGQQLDVRVVHGSARPDTRHDVLSAAQVAGYLAKYATKDARNAGGRERQPTAHVRRLRETCQDLSGRSISEWSAEDNPYLLLGKWEHALGFRGHFSSKSRGYSVTLGALRRARARWHQVVSEASRRGEVLDSSELERRILAENNDSTLIVGDWCFAGSGWPRAGDKELAVAAASRAREYEEWRAEQDRTFRR